MKYLLLLSLFFTGCSTSKSISEDAFIVMCNNYELAICDDFKGDTYSYQSMNDVRMYALNLFNGNYIYTRDPVSKDKDYYYYMDDNPMRGDCEDYVITLLENLIVLGMVDKGEAEWVIGEVGGASHSWLLITKGSSVYLFDTGHRYGTNIKETYNYEYMFTVYRY